MKLLNSLITAGMIVGSVGAIADTLTTENLKTAQAAAIEMFRQNEGEEAYLAIVGLAIDKSTTGTSARAKVTYKDGGVKKSVSYFCHFHGPDEIDCH